MKTLRTLVLCVGVGVALGGCSGDDEDDGGGDGNSRFFCQLEEMGEVIACSRYTVPDAALESSRDACTVQEGIVVSACPTADLIGTCSVLSGSLVMYQYVAGGQDAAEAQMMCEALDGEWSAR